MIDIKLIRMNPELFKLAMKQRNSVNLDEIIDQIIKIDEDRRELSTLNDNMKFEQNKATKQVPILKKENKDISSLMVEMKTLSDKIKLNDEKITELKSLQKQLLLNLPNIPSSTTCVGINENDNEEVRRWGDIVKFDFEPKPHWELGEALGILDSETASKVTGSRFYFYKGLAARLERAIINFYLDSHIKSGYTEILPPFIVNRDSMTGTGQLPKFENDAFKIQGLDYFLIPTAEVPLTNMYRGDIISSDNLPIKYCAYSPCFRSEAGSAGRDTRGLIRMHQFNKVELVKFVKPEDSYEELEKLTNDAEQLLKDLKLPYRVVNLCTGDLGFSSAKTYDIEVYMPSYSGYKEISSCSNFEDFQARRCNIRYKDSIKDKAKFIHTLNGSGLAISRTVAAVMENYQQKDGSIIIPEVLFGYMGGETIIK